MCGIAGVIHRDGAGSIGAEITRMLQAMKHRGPDSTGYALYGPPGDLVVVRFVLAEPNETGFGVTERLERNRVEVESRLAKIGAKVDRVENETGYAFRALIRYEGELKPLADYLEDIPGCEVLSLGRSLEIIKDLGDARTVHDQYRLEAFEGTHAIGHVRMATESDVDLASAHPYWAYPFADVAVGAQRSAHQLSPVEAAARESRTSVPVILRLGDNRGIPGRPNGGRFEPRVRHEVEP